VAAANYTSITDSNPPLVSKNAVSVTKSKSPGMIIMLGDFNYVTDTASDRRHRVDAAVQQQQQQQQQPPQSQQQHQHHHHQQHHPLPRDTVPAAAEAQHVPDSFVMPGATGTLRAGRLHMSEQLVASRHEDNCAGLSDHLLVMAQRQPQPLGHGLQRCACHSKKPAACRTAMQQWLVSQQAPADATAHYAMVASLQKAAGS
jgi:hypothetical protein